MLVLFCNNTIFCIVSSQLAAILPLAVAHTFGNLFTNMSLELVRKSIIKLTKSQEKEKKNFETSIISNQRKKRETKENDANRKVKKINKKSIMDKPTWH